MKKITVKEINDIIWSDSEYDTSGEVDSGAMRERLRDMLNAEMSYKILRSNISEAARSMNKLLSYGK